MYSAAVFTTNSTTQTSRSAQTYMSDFIGKPTFTQVQDIVDLSMCSALIALLFSQLLLRKGSVRLHYHLLLLATTLGLISAAMRVSVTNYYDIDVKKFAAYSVLQNSSSAFIQLAAVLALHKFTATYLGGAMPLITIMCSIGVAWTIVFIVISGLDAGGLLAYIVSSSWGATLPSVAGQSLW